MSDPQTRTNVWQSAAASVDAGLRAYMLRVYNLMALAVGVTGLVSYYVASNEALLFAIAGSPLKWVLFIGILGLGFLAPRLILAGSPSAGHMAFWSYAVLWGLLIAPFIYASTGANVARAFLITSVVFASLSLYGYTTKRDLAPWGKFLFMAAVGLLVVFLVSIFLPYNETFSLLLSIGVVLVFSALTAYETQAVKDSYNPSDDERTAKSKGVFGAFILYGSFVTLFIHILNILNIFGGD